MVSMKDVAAACGVSVATVSKALSNHRDIGEVTRQQIKAVADEMGYLPNQSARYLKTNRSYNLGVLFDDTKDGSGLNHDFFAAVLQSFKETAERQGYDVTFLNTVCSDMSYVERARFRGFDGVAIANFDFNNPKVQELLRSDLKVVTVDYIVNDRSGVVSDNAEGIRSLLTYIIGKGHRKIAYIYGDNGRVTRQRLGGYYRTMEEHGIPTRPEYMKPSYYRNIDMAYRLTEELLALPDPPTCILYPDDVASFGGRNAIKAHGLSIPGDISVAGYDGIRAAQYGEPRLTTVRQDVEDLGKRAAELLIDEVERPMTALPTIYTSPSVLLEGQTVRDMTDRGAEA